MPSREEKDAKAARRARKTSDPAQQPAFLANATASSSSQGFRRQDRPTKVRGLTKQTYSAYVTAPGSSGPPKKWHLTVSLYFHVVSMCTQSLLSRPTSLPPITMNFQLSSKTLSSLQSKSPKAFMLLGKVSPENPTGVSVPDISLLVRSLPLLPRLHSTKT